MKNFVSQLIVACLISVSIINVSSIVNRSFMPSGHKITAFQGEKSIISQQLTENSSKLRSRFHKNTGLALSKSGQSSVDCVPASSEEGFSVSAKAAYLTDFYTGKCMYRKNEEDKLPIASMCKIMTLLLSFDAVEKGQISLTDTVRVSENASSMGGSQVFLRANEDYLCSDLIKSIIISSANDSCVAMAERISGNTEVFVAEMNQKALDLGMNNTVFQNCTGLPKPGQFSTAKDVSIMLSALLRHETYFEFSRIWMDQMNHADGTHTEMANTNKLVRFFDGCDGGKTGFTQEAKFCLAATAKRGDFRLISVIIGAEDGKTRFKESSDLLNYGFANYRNEKIVDKGAELEQAAKIRGGKVDCVKVRPEKDFYLLLSKAEKANVQTETVLQEEKAPLTEGQRVGTIFLYREGVQIAEIPLLSAESVEAKTFWDSLRDVIKGFPLVK